MGIMNRINDHFAERNTRRALSRLDDHILRDIGVAPDNIRGAARARGIYGV